MNAPQPTHAVECACGGRMSVDMGRLTTFIVDLFRAHHRGEGHDVTETINERQDP